MHRVIQNLVGGVVFSESVRSMLVVRKKNSRLASHT
jgi:hypothetical protein